MSQTPRDMVTALECALATLEMEKGEKRTSFHHEPHYHCSQNSVMLWRAQEDPLTQPSSQDKPVPTDSECCITARPFKSWLTGCPLHTAPQPQAPTINLMLNGIPVPTLLDSGIHPGLSLSPYRTSYPCGSLAVTCVHGNVREIPAA